jgi:hypothetical protein
LLTLMQWTYLFDLVQRVAGGDQDLFRRAAAIGGQAPPRSRSSTSATLSPTLRVGSVTPKPALPPPRISTS